MPRGETVDPFFSFVEGSELASWVRGESIEWTFVFPVVVTLHTIGMGFLAGGSAAIDLRILGLAPRMPLKPMRQFLPILWLSFAINALTGILLLVGSPVFLSRNLAGKTACLPDSPRLGRSRRLVQSPA